MPQDFLLPKEPNPDLYRAASGANLISLSLHECGVTAAGVAAVVESAAWPALHTLHLGGADLGDEGACLLAGAAHWRSLHVLSLTGCRVGDAGAAALAEAAHLRGLDELGLVGNRLGDAGARALAESPYLRAVSYLDLSNNLIGEAGALALGRSRNFDSLRHLRLGVNAVSPSRARAAEDAAVRRDPSALDAPAEVAEPPAALAPLPVGKLSADEAGLRQAIADDPDDELPLLAYADWFDDNGDPQRAELIRLQIHSFDDGGAAAKKLVKANAARWLGGLRKFTKASSFERGSLWVSVPTRTFLTKAFQAESPEMLERAGVSGLDLTGRTSRWEPLADAPALTAVRELRIEHVWPVGLRALLNSPRLVHLHTLHLSSEIDFGELGQGDFGPSSLPRLRRLYLRFPVGSTEEFVAALLAWPRLARLTTLNLSDNWLGWEEVTQLAESPRVAALRRLDLSSNYMTDTGIAALVASRHLANLTELKLRDCGGGEEASRLLASSSRLGKLALLDVSHNLIGEAGARALLESPALAGVRRFVLRSCGLKAGVAAALRERHGDRVIL